MAKITHLGGFVSLTSIAKNVLGEDCDPQVEDVQEKNPPSVEDKTEPAKGVAKPKESKDLAPAGTSKKKEKESKYTNLANYIPAEVTRAEKDEVPTIKDNFDEELMEEEDDEELEDNFDEKHIVKLKESESWEDEEEVDREIERKHERRQRDQDREDIRRGTANESEMTELSSDTYKSASDKRTAQAQAADRIGDDDASDKLYARAGKTDTAHADSIARKRAEKDRNMVAQAKKGRLLSKESMEARVWQMGDRIAAMNEDGVVRHFALTETHQANAFAFKRN